MAYAATWAGLVSAHFLDRGFPHCCVPAEDHRIAGHRKGQGNTRGGGWEFVHVAIDDASRAFTLYPNGAARMGYARAYQTSDQRAAELQIWTPHYNWHRPHGSLKSNPPISRLGLSEDSLMRLHS
jgi:transposase InsO family protein